MKVLLFALNMVLGMVIPLGIQIADRRRLSAAERPWVWNTASWGSALYNFGPLSLIAWGYVTRSPRYWWGLLNGVMLTEIALVAQGLINEGLGRALALSPKALGETRDGFLASGLVVVGLAVLIGAGRSAYEGARPLLRRLRPGRAAPPAAPLSQRYLPPRPPGDLHHDEQGQDGAHRDR